MYGLIQAGRLDNNLLTESLTPKGYFQCTHTIIKAPQMVPHIILLGGRLLQIQMFKKKTCQLFN